MTRPERLWYDHRVPVRTGHGAEAPTPQGRVEGRERGPSATGVVLLARLSPFWGSTLASGRAYPAASPSLRGGRGAGGLGARKTEDSSAGAAAPFGGRRRPARAGAPPFFRGGRRARARAARATREIGGPPWGGRGGEFDPGSGSTLAACLMHASRAGRASARSRGGRVRNTWATCPGAGNSRGKPRVIPHGPVRREAGRGKARATPGGACGRLAGRRGDGPPWR